MDDARGRTQWGVCVCVCVGGGADPNIKKTKLGPLLGCLGHFSQRILKNKSEFLFSRDEFSQKQLDFSGRILTRIQES